MRDDVQPCEIKELQENNAKKSKDLVPVLYTRVVRYHTVHLRKARMVH